jgi:Helix-turn-helix domain
MTPTADSWGYVSDVSAARILRIKPATLANWRSRGHGPPYYKIGKQVLYRPDDVDRWIVGQRRQP